MCEAMRRLMQDEIAEEVREAQRDGMAQGIAQGMAQGEMKAKKETALTLAARGMSVSDIAEVVKVSVKLVQEWLSGSISFVN